MTYRQTRCSALSTREDCVTRPTARLTFALWLAIPSLVVLTAQAGRELAVPVRLTAFAVNMSNIATGGANVVDIQIDRWSTEEERQKLITTFVEKGPEKLLDALQDLKRIGYIRLPNTLGYDLRYARMVPLDEGGQKILIATDRRIGFAEARNQPRTMDYPFTLIEIRLKPDGTGEGKLSLATKITLNKKTKTVELENYSSEPVRLQNVKVEQK
jgi:hypothetical protein